MSLLSFLLAIPLPLTVEVRDQLYQEFLALVEEIRATLKQHDQRTYDQLIARYNIWCDWFRDHGRRDSLLVEDEREIQCYIQDWREALSQAQCAADWMKDSRIARVSFDYYCLHCPYVIKDMPRAIVYHLRIAHPL